MALLLSGCFARTPGAPTSGQSTSSSSTTTSPEEDTTYGTLDNPISVSRAIELGLAAFDGSSQYCFLDKDAYVKGIVKTVPRESTKEGKEGTYEFKIGENYEASPYVDFYYGGFEQGVAVPVEGDEVVLFGRLACFNVDTVELVGSTEQQIADPVVMKSEHKTYNIKLNKTGDGTITGVPETAKSGDTINFTVAPATSYDVDEVLIDGIYNYSKEYKYSFVVKTNTSIDVSLVKDLVKTDLRKAFEAGLEIEAGKETTDKYTYEGNVIGLAGNSFYIQDGKYGMYVYAGKTAYEGVELGKRVSVESTIKNYDGLVETGKITAVTAKTDAPILPTAGNVTSLKTLKQLRQNVLANAKNATFISKKGDWSGSNSPIATFAIGDDEVEVKFDKYGYNQNKEQAEKFNKLATGDVVNLLSVITSTFKGNPQFAFNGTSSFDKEIEPVVPIESVTVTPATKTIEVKEKATLTAKVLPEKASQEVVWSSNNAAVSVDKDTGEIEGKSVGSAVVTATSKADSTKSGSCTVTVNPILVTEVKFQEDSLSLLAGGDTGTIHVTVSPEDATTKTLSWDSSNKNVATVENGVVTPLNVGTSTITATSTDGSNKSDSLVVTVTDQAKHVESVSVSPTEVTLRANKTQDLTLTVLPDDATNKNVTWSSTDETIASIAEVDSKYVITAHKVGKATITATSVDDPQKSASCVVTVEATPVTGISLDKPTLNLSVDGTEKLTATITPDDATDKEVVWSTSDDKVATVDKGTVTAVGAGTATITAAAHADTTKTATCTVKVTAGSQLEKAYNDALAGEAGETVYNMSGVVTAITSSSFYMQDGAYGMYAFKPTKGEGSGDLAVGKNVTLNSKVTVYNGLVEAPEGGEYIIGDVGVMPTQVDIDSQDTLDELKLNVLVGVTELKVKSINGVWSSQKSVQITVLAGEDEVIISCDKNGHDQNPSKAVVEGIKADDTISVNNAVVGIYNNKLQIAFTGTSTMTKKAVPATGISFNSGSYDVNQGSKLDMSKEVVLTPPDATDEVTYSVTGNTGVSIDPKSGLLTVSANAPTSNIATVTATAGQLEATCKIVVKESSTTETTSSLIFTAKCDGSGTSDNGEKWTITSDGAESTFDANKGIHYGTGKAAVQYIKLTSSDFTSGKIKSITVNASTAKGVEDATVGVKINSVQFGGSPKSIDLNATEYAFTGEVNAGSIEIEITKPASATGALYCKSVVVVYAA